VSYLTRRLGRGARRLTRPFRGATGALARWTAQAAAGKVSVSTGAATATVLGFLAWTFGTWVVLGFLGTPSHLGGWWRAAIAFSPGAVALPAILLGGRWLIVAPVGIVLAAGLGALAYTTATPGFDRLEAAAVPVPSSWTLLLDEHHGNDWCLQGCPELYRVYQTTDTPGQVADQYRAALINAGWKPSRVPNTSSERLQSEQWTRHGVHIDLSVPGARARDYPPQVPNDLTKVEVWIGSEH
jgi:hypothetical protein